MLPRKLANGYILTTPADCSEEISIHDFELHISSFPSITLQQQYARSLSCNVCNYRLNLHLINILFIIKYVCSCITVQYDLLDRAIPHGIAQCLSPKSLTL